MGRGPHALGITPCVSELVQHPGLFLESNEKWLKHVQGEGPRCGRHFLTSLKTTMASTTGADG